MINGFRKIDDEKFKKIGQGYENDKSHKIELQLEGFNYAIYISPKGFLKMPFTGKIEKLRVTDILTEQTIMKILADVKAWDIDV